MLLFIIRRVLAAIPVMVMTSIIIFMLMRLLPGDPVTMVSGEAQSDMAPEVIAQLRHKYGLDQPVYLQYLAWVERAVSGDLGYSIYSRQPVWEVVEPRILPTLQIGMTAWLLALCISVPLGAYSALRLNSWVDWLATALSLVGAATPYFLIGGLLIYLVALQWGLLPASGYVSPFEDFRQSVRVTILPALTLTFALTAVLTRQARTSFAQVLGFPYIRTARAKGLSERAVVIGHAFRNAMLPITTILGLELGTMFSGAVVTETVFAIPGVGRLLVNAILSRDYAVVQAVVLFITLSVVLANLLVDIAYNLLDPRTRAVLG